MVEVDPSTPLDVQGDTSMTDVPYYPYGFEQRNPGNPQGPTANN
jgi:hypothetical protein